MLNFAAISPHPPLLLPGVGAKQKKEKVKDTIKNLKSLGNKFDKKNPDRLIIISPHPDWGFDVPLFFIGKNFKKEKKKILVDSKAPSFYFKKGKEKAKELSNKEVAIIASGDLSHCLKNESPYGFHKDGPSFDKELIESLKNKEINKILNLNKKFPKAKACGLQSISFLLGFLEEIDNDWRVDILSYEGPFGVGYLVAEIIIL